MKNRSVIFLLSIFLAGIAGCAPDNETSLHSDQDAEFTIPDMAHNSQNSLDWQGTYSGRLPCADCEGIETQLALHENNTYELATTYLGKSDEIFRENGSFTWHQNGNQITLDVAEGSRPSGYLVQENRLVQLDMEGNRITGDLADHYVLQKTANELADRYWKLAALNNQPIDTTQTGPKEPHIILHPFENRVSGTGGCNSVVGSYTLTGENNLSFSQMISTKMACQNAVYEDSFLMMLHLMATYTMAGDTLTLYSPTRDTTILFIEKPEFN